MGAAGVRIASHLRRRRRRPPPLAVGRDECGLDAAAAEAAIGRLARSPALEGDAAALAQVVGDALAGGEHRRVLLEGLSQAEGAVGAAKEDFCRLARSVALEMGAIEALQAPQMAAFVREQVLSLSSAKG